MIVIAPSSFSNTDMSWRDFKIGRETSEPKDNLSSQVKFQEPHFQLIKQQRASQVLEPKMKVRLDGHGFNPSTATAGGSHKF